jgi:hypothetical protein
MDITTEYRELREPLHAVLAAVQGASIQATGATEKVCLDIVIDHIKVAIRNLIESEFAAMRFRS